MHSPHPHRPININQAHAESLSLNERVALAVSKRVGTMWFCYGLAMLMLVWGAVNMALGEYAFDKYPFSFLFFCLGGIMQSLLMPLIMVAQNLDAKHAEAKTDEEYRMTLKVCHDNETIITQNNRLLAMLGEKDIDVLDETVNRILYDLNNAIQHCKTIEEAQQLIWKIASREEQAS